ncbi:hypothetical protein EV702DRAFT_1199789 [Suillus placidus]|uniref:Uncharacterized protein n=1 Tax=Suillus placidus TaxID=48579 RepID=A0A9P6ZQQ7_9AGAM|nr:hypothetical protein EV702DRAFT_1199789 [Suillus placidus]
MSAPEPGHIPHSFPHPDLSGAVPTSTEARAKRRIAALEEELQGMKEERGMKQRKTTYYVAQDRAIRQMAILYTNLEDLIGKNDRRYEEGSGESTSEQDRLQHGYITLAQVLLWLHGKLSELDIDNSQDMLKKLKRGADAAHSDNTSTLKDLIAIWINDVFRPSPLLKSDDKRSCGFAHDVCRKLLSPAEWDWSDDWRVVKTGIRDRTLYYIVSENSWLLFLYENYLVDHGNLKKGLFKSKILVKAFKATFTSPSSARKDDGDGIGTDILENNRRA